MKYMLVSSETSKDLADEVNNLISLGYQLYGNPCLSGGYGQTTVYIQAMVKYDLELVKDNKSILD